MNWFDWYGLVLLVWIGMIGIIGMIGMDWQKLAVSTEIYFQSCLNGILFNRIIESRHVLLDYHTRKTFSNLTRR